MSKQVSFSATVCALTMALFAVTMSLADHLPTGSSVAGETQVFGATFLTK
ncbi:hypothetical protein [Pontixanthobacter gangjinensis]|uniref:Uncharacterized protein n=1 Tax=Pontixanthobacter gangjinensis TaxID=1028742 RepID=A0A6I4SKU5_9SPHN|nr:hypothetical protein [Pontixanthobacter gangjinensis]MXO56274.1 hypothetical protein [Pontixanthobacter gangjinensis]